MKLIIVLIRPFQQKLWEDLSTNYQHPAKIGLKFVLEDLIEKIFINEIN